MLPIRHGPRCFASPVASPGEAERRGLHARKLEGSNRTIPYRTDQLGEFIMLLRFIAVAGALLMLAACSSAPEQPVGGPSGPGGPGGISGSRFGPGSQQDLAATAGDRVFFDYDRAEISSEGQQILQRQAE